MPKTHKLQFSQQERKQLFYPILIISLCACFLFYKYILQVYPSIITTPLMQEFHLTGVGLGNLAATYYYAYMIMQLFVGILLDRYSARWFSASALFCCALGVTIFSQATTLPIAELSRVMMGIGVAFATVAYMKLAAVWFHPKHYAFVGGFLGTAAMAGAVFGQAPLSLAIEHFGWRDCLFIIGIAGFIISFLFILIVRDSPSSPPQATVYNTINVSLQDIIKVFKNKQNWLLTFYSGLAFCPIAVFGGLWGDPFLQEAYHLDKTMSAFLISLIFIGFGIGSPILGMLSDRLGDRRNLMFICAMVSTVLFSIVLYCPVPIWLLGSLLFSFGFLLGSYMLVFAIAKEINSIFLTATVIAMINSSDALLDAITEPSIGKILDLTWQGQIVDGIHYFSLHSYHIALGILPVYLFVAALLLLWVKNPD